MSLEVTSVPGEHAQPVEIETGNAIPDSTLPQEFTPRKKPQPKTYQNSSKRNQVSKRLDKAVVSEKASSDVSDLSPSEADEPMNEAPKAASRGAKRQLSKTIVREPTKLPTRTKRAVSGKGKPKTPSSADDSEGSDLTDIGEEKKGGKGAAAGSGKDQANSGRSRRIGKAAKYAESESEGSAAPSKPLPKKVKAAGKGKKSEPVVPEDDDAEHSASSLSSLGGSATGDADAVMDTEKRSSKDQSSRGNLAASKRKEPASSKAKAQFKLTAAKKSEMNEKDDVPLKETQDFEPIKFQKSEGPKQAKPRANPIKKVAGDSTAKMTGGRKRAVASTSSTTSATLSTKKTTAGRKGKAQPPKPQSSTQLSDPFFELHFGSSQTKPSKPKIASDTESSDDDEDEHQKVLKLFDTTRHTPQKRKGKELQGAGRGKKQKKGVNGDMDSTADSSTESEDEPEEIEFKRDLSALDGAYVYCRNGRLGLYFGGVVVGFDDLKELSPAKKKKHKDGIYLIRLPFADDKVIRKRRDEFFTEDDDEFATCKLGETAPEAVVGEEPSDARTRLSTPPLPPDIDTTPFDDLDHAVQLQAIRPHLEKVIKEEYFPAQLRIDRFWFKGKARSFVQWHGNLSAYAIDDIFVPELTRWALRPPLKRTEANGDAEESARPPRPVGSERFEALDDDEREFYVQKILVNEAIIHICLKSEKLEELDLQALMAEWADDDMYPEDTDLERKTVLMRDLVAKKELDRLAHEEPDAYSIWASLMETRNRKRTEKGLPLEGEKQEEKPIKERGGRAARARNNVSYRE